jgi:hypothetical protein
MEALEHALLRNPVALAILQRAGDLALPSWYLGAGAVAQTVWNELHGFEPTRGIKDYDLVYFDPDDLSLHAEQKTAQIAMERFADLGVELDVKNEARVHLWYAQRFGRSIAQFRSTEAAISTWPTTASSIGARYEDGDFVVCAPFGLSDVFGMIARPNKTIITQAVYEAKAERWAALWPKLSVIPW